MTQFLAEATRDFGITDCRFLCNCLCRRHLRQRITRCFTWTVAALFTQVLCAVSANAKVTGRPNVVLILTDDQGWGDLGSSGNDMISTPTLDALAGESVRLDRFYVSPVCAPTRAALMTGRYPERTGVSGVTGRREVMRANETTMAEMFRDAGYSTGCFGKWHNGAQMPLHPNGQGFEEFFGFCGGHFNLYDDPVLERNGVPVETKGYITDLLTDAAIEFIKTSREKPFFCYVPYNAPHGPFQIRQDLFDKYNTGKVSEKTAAVYAMVENIDGNVKRLLATLDDQGKAKETIVLFLTDNGPNGKRFNGGMRGAKGSIHEGGCRVPCFIRWPGKITPNTITQIAGHIDLLPTLAHWCDLELPHSLNLDGKSLVSLVRDGTDDALADRSILTYRPNQKDLQAFSKAAVRTNQYRLTIENGKTSLFDMHADPDQQTDIAGRSPETTRRLKAEIDQYFHTIRPGITETARVPIGKRRPTFIPSVDATLVGQPSFADGINWAHSWVDHWMTKEDRISWPVDFMEGGRYLVTLHYVCDSKNVSVTANVGGESVMRKLRRHKSESRIRPDLDSNSDPRRMQSFHAQPMGIVNVDGGHTTIELSRSDTDGAMIELGGVTITNADLPSKQDFHLFLLAGQSNMAGRGKVTAADRYPDPNVLMLDRNAQWVPATDPVHFDKSVAGVGLGRGFARAYASRHPGVTVGLVPCAVGGSPIDSWKPGGYHEQTQSSPYDDALPRIQTAMQNGTFKGILWHQGESDSTPGRAQKYKASLAEVLSRFREQFGEQTPILIGGLAQREVPAWTDARKRVDRSHRELARELPDCAFVESTGLTLKGDNIHFDRDSLLEFGRRYEEALMGIVESRSK